MSRPSLPHGLISYGPDANCTLELCPVQASVYEYRPSLVANATFLALFGLALVIQLILGLRYRTWFFMAATICGNLAEILGYAGRIMLWQDPFSFNGFLLQIVCITFAPAFFSGAIYVTISRVIQYLDPRLSTLSPRLFYWLFIPFDLVSLVLQATGGGLSSNSSGTSQPAIDVAIAGLAFQVFTMTIFIGLALDYAARYMKHRARNPTIARGDFDVRFRVFLAFLTLAIVVIFIRCIYRIDELKDGYSGPGITDEALFIGLESVMVTIAALSLCIAHPGAMLRLDTAGIGKAKTEA